MIKITSQYEAKTDFSSPSSVWVYPAPHLLAERFAYGDNVTKWEDAEFASTEIRALIAKFNKLRFKTSHKVFSSQDARLYIKKLMKK